jgi:hypothetical protein
MDSCFKAISNQLLFGIWFGSNGRIKHIKFYVLGIIRKIWSLKGCNPFRCGVKGQLFTKTSSGKPIHAQEFVE